MNARTTLTNVMGPRLADGERVLAGGFAWVAIPRTRVPLLALARHPHLIGITDRRVVLFRQPARGRALAENHLILDAPFAALTLERVRVVTPMLQVRMRLPNRLVHVIEFRPRDRATGHRLAAVLRDQGAVSTDRVPVTASG